MMLVHCKPNSLMFMEGSECTHTGLARPSWWTEFGPYTSGLKLKSPSYKSRFWVMEQLNYHGSIPSGHDLITDGNFQDWTTHLLSFKQIVLQFTGQVKPHVWIHVAQICDFNHVHHSTRTLVQICTHCKARTNRSTNTSC